jgi:hypothetical protein
MFLLACYEAAALQQGISVELFLRAFLAGALEVDGVEYLLQQASGAEKAGKPATATSI